MAPVRAHDPFSPSSVSSPVVVEETAEPTTWDGYVEQIAAAVRDFREANQLADDAPVVFRVGESTFAGLVEDADEAGVDAEAELAALGVRIDLVDSDDDATLVAADNPPPGDYPSDEDMRTVDNAIAWVGGDPARAVTALAIERENENRKTLVAYLEPLVDAYDPDAGDGDENPSEGENDDQGAPEGADNG